ncbi:hypothetical protein ACI8B_210284 [Acinetobacter proteolyticus]|uniref:Uncharacterized protein n=1 Tax=Acinetobacter proteolyticus TaxID=1776741 RepID=A0A653K3S6_9GAMM|nr:hypothetical protein ACI8B_210284 [Acinetobacter proteolyticus]
MKVKEFIELLFNIIFRMLGQAGFEYFIIGFFLIILIFIIFDKVHKGK